MRDQAVLEQVALPAARRALDLVCGRARMCTLVSDPRLIRHYTYTVLVPNVHRTGFSVSLLPASACVLVPPTCQ